MSRTPAVVAHRGNSSVAPQNTLAAFEAAWRAGADMIELDIQLTADGEIVVIHDAQVDATTDGTGGVASQTLAELRALDAGSWFGPAYTGQRIPTFEEVLAFLVDRPGTDLLLELKDVWTTPDAARATAAIDAAGLAGRVTVQSFYPQTVLALGEAAPHLPRGWLVEQPHDGLLDICGRLGVVACNPSIEMVLADDGLVRRLHRAGLRVLVWTADDVDQWTALLAADDGAGVEGIITDRPDRLLGWLAGRTSSTAR